MIGKISARGSRVAGLLYYLYGPGRNEAHTDPHLVAGWRDPAELEPALHQGRRRDFRRLAGLLQQPHAALGPRDQEARIREGRWADPNAGMTTVSEWIDRWLPIQDVGIGTQDSREYLIRRFIRPTWGSSPLNALSTEGITNWENGLPARAGISRRTARDARGLLCTILGDAAAHKPPLIPYNPALRPCDRGRRTGRRLERGAQRAWATPLEVLLTAERAALLSGRDDDFTMILTIAYTGLRWGETIGLEHGYLHADQLHVEWQLREIRGTFYRLPPKDDSYRSPHWNRASPSTWRRFLPRSSPGR